MILDEVQHYCPANRICRGNGNFSEKTCKIANNQERAMTLQCAAGIMILLDRLVKAAPTKG